MIENLEQYVANLPLEIRKKEELSEFINENDWVDIIEDVIKHVENDKFYRSQSKVVGLDDKGWFITNGMLGSVQLTDRAYFSKDSLIAILEGSKPYLSQFDDEDT